MIQCINLRERYGVEFHVWRECHDDCRANPELFDKVAGSDPWRMIIPGKYGEISPWGGECLAVSTKRRGGISRQLAALPGCRVVADGDDGQTIAFPASLFQTVAEIVKPRRRRRLSPERRAECADRLRMYHFPAARKRAPEPLKTLRAA